jgi:hypothetical protein
VVDSTLVTRHDPATGKDELVIPAEHLRGVVRDACTQVLLWRDRACSCCAASRKKGPSGSEVLSTCGLNFPSGKDVPCVLCRLFGTTFTPRRYQFFDAELKEPETIKPEEARRVSLHNRVDAATGRVPEETFFAFELGQRTTFKGHIERDSPQKDAGQLLEEAGLLLAGLRLVERVGGKPGRGWGRCEVKVTALNLADGEHLPEALSKAEGVNAQVDAWLEAYLKPGRDPAEEPVGA